MLNKDNEKDKFAIDRLILSKSLYLHGLEHSRISSSLDKMIAVHNFHNAIEITLRTIILYYNIRPGKELNVTFEQMLNEIDKYSDKKLPYRQQLVILNNMRNMVQHHATEPPESGMEEWRVYSKGFLKKTYEKYFDLSFDDLTLIDFIENQNLRNMLHESKIYLNNRDWENAIIKAKEAFHNASISIAKFLPCHPSYSPLRRVLLTSHPPISSSCYNENKKLLQWQFEQIDKQFLKLYNNVQEKQFNAAILSTGVNVADLKKINDINPSVELSIAGQPIVFSNNTSNEEDSQWIFNFVSEIIIKWQILGLEPVAINKD